MSGPSFSDIARLASAGVMQRYRPLLAHLTVTRYCNLDCGYCNEFDKVSKPVPTEELYARIDRLVIHEERVEIVDLKTGRPHLAAADVAILRQMALYRAMSRCKRSAISTGYGTAYSFTNPRYL